MTEFSRIKSSSECQIFNSINVTAGLSILRVSPDHGPAFDIAKKKSAKINSIIASLKFIENTIDD